LTEEKGIKIARALGLPDAASQKICLDCHADNVPPNLRGPEFHLQDDNVGCEACHGGASSWLGIHISGATHEENVRAGLYPTEQPDKRAERCLGCHFGDETRFLDHRIYGAGHPRLRFELDTFTAIQPAHFEVTPSYVARKGRITDMQVWGAGQAIALIRRMDAILDPRRQKGVFPDFVVFDCQSCHHMYEPYRPLPAISGQGPGSVKLNDANAVMFSVAAKRVAPAVAQNLSTHMLALHRASNEDWAAAKREAAAVRQAAASLVPTLSHHDYSREDIFAMANAVIALGVEPVAESARVEQIALTLGAIRSQLISSGYIDESQSQATMAAIQAITASFPTEGTVKPDEFIKAVKDFQRALGR